MMPTTRRPALPLVIIAALFALLVTFALFAIAMQAGVGMLIVFVLAMILMLAFSLFLFRGFAAAGLSIVDKRLEAQREKNRHVEAMAKMEAGHRTLQIEPPSGESVTSAEVATYFNLARELVGVTVDKLGPNSTQLLPFNRASKEKLTPFDDVGMWQNAMKWFMQNGYAKENREGEKSLGVFLLNGRTAREMFDRMMN